MRRRLIVLLIGGLVMLGPSLAPARAALFDSFHAAVVRLRDALPVRVTIGPPASWSAAQRDSVRRIRLARLAALSGEKAPAWVEDCAFLPHGIVVTFSIADTVARDVVVQQRDTDGEWRVAGRARADKAGRATWRDSTSRPGRFVELALALRTKHGTRLVLLPRVRMPGDGLRLLARSDSRGTRALWLRLPTNHPATLDLFDIAGRKVGALDLSRCYAGEYEVPVPSGLFPGPGVYFARLVQNEAWATEKLIVP
jgi:hypothetical protein